MRYFDTNNDDGSNLDGGTTDKTVVDTTKADTSTDTTTIDKVEPAWPENWRNLMAGDDAKELKRLERFASPSDVYKLGYRKLEARMSSGELKQALPKDAKPEEIAQWRKDNGIPETPDKYELKLDNNLVIGEQDKPIVDMILQTAHGANYTPAQAKAAVQAYYDIQSRNVEALVQKDDTDRVAAVDGLIQEYGKGYRQTLGKMEAEVLGLFPSTIQDGLKNARMPDGTALFNNVDFIKGLVALSYELNPSATVVPAGGGDAAKNLNERITEIEGMMGSKAYKKNAEIQQEYRDLIAAREKISQRKAA